MRDRAKQAEAVSDELITVKMTALSDSVIFRNRFATPESRAIWSDERRTEYYLQFEKCLVEAQAELSIVRFSYDTTSPSLTIVDTAEGM